MAYGLMNKGSNCQSPLASFSLKPIKKLWGAGEVDLRTLASGHGREREGHGAKVQQKLQIQNS
jgi:hypothetical protein